MCVYTVSDRLHQTTKQEWSSCVSSFVWKFACVYVNSWQQKHAYKPTYKIKCQIYSDKININFIYCRNTKDEWHSKNGFYHIETTTTSYNSSTQINLSSEPFHLRLDTNVYHKANIRLNSQTKVKNVTEKYIKM